SEGSIILKAKRLGLTRNCIVCGKTIPSNRKFCSHECYLIMRRIRRRKNEN
ncbi:MAG: hypothetical protein DRI61_15445, partial [Chloroflexi bacterium]